MMPAQTRFRVRLPILDVARSWIEGELFWGRRTDPSHHWAHFSDLQNRELDPPVPWITRRLASNCLTLRIVSLQTQRQPGVDRHATQKR
jgi:hypothetical protein